jgi:hypothetical protein
MGFTDGVRQAVSFVTDRFAITGSPQQTGRYQRTNKCLGAFLTTGDKTIEYEAGIVSMDADGFTVNFTTTVSGNHLYYLALNITSYVGSLTQPTTVSEQEITAPAFYPGAILMQGVSQTAQTTAQDENRYSLGATDGNSQVVHSAGTLDVGDHQGAVWNSVTAHYESDALLAASITPAVTGSSSTLDVQGAFLRRSAVGFTIDWSVVNGVSQEWVYLAFSGAPAVPPGLYSEFDVADANVNPYVLKRTVEVTEALNETPNNCTFVMRSATGFPFGGGLLKGRPLTLSVTSPAGSTREFAGHVLDVDLLTKNKNTRHPRYRAHCIDYTWQFDWKKVQAKKWVQVSAEQIIKEMVAEFAPAFIVDAHLSNIPISTDDPSALIHRLTFSPDLPPITSAGCNDLGGGTMSGRRWAIVTGVQTVDGVDYESNVSNSAGTIEVNRSLLVGWSRPAGGEVYSYYRVYWFDGPWGQFTPFGPEGIADSTFVRFTTHANVIPSGDSDPFGDGKDFHTVVSSDTGGTDYFEHTAAATAALVDFQSNDDEAPSAFMTRLMRMIGGYWSIDYDRVVHANLLSNGGTFQALYLQNTAAPYTPPTYRGSWNTTAGSVTKALSRSKATGGEITTVSVAEATATNPYDVLLYRGVGPKMRAQSLAGTLNVVIGLAEANADADFNLHLHVFVTAGDTDTVRGTLISDFVEAAGVKEWPTTAAGVTLSAAQAITSLSISAGDRLVVEIGYRSRNSHTTSRAGTLSYGTMVSGSPVNDLSNGSEGVASLAGFLVFSSAIKEQDGPNPLTDTSDAFWDFVFTEDVSQVRTRVRCHGGSSSTSVAVGTGATSIPIDETRLFASTGGLALAGANRITYTGKSAAEGPGSLTGVTGVTYAITQGETVTVLAEAEDNYAMATMAAISGGDGQFEHSFTDGNRGDAAARLAAQGDLALHSGPEQFISFKTRDPLALPGSTVSVDVTNPQTGEKVQGDFLIRSVRVTECDRAHTLYPLREVQAGRSLQDLYAMLSPLAITGTGADE